MSISLFVHYDLFNLPTRFVKVGPKTIVDTPETQVCACLRVC